MEHRLISIDGTADDEGEGVEVSAVAWLINGINSSKMKVVLTRLRSLCSRRKRGAAIFLNEEQLARAQARRAAHARGASRGPARTSQLRAQVAELQAGQGPAYGKGAKDGGSDGAEGSAGPNPSQGARSPHGAVSRLDGHSARMQPARPEAACRCFPPLPFGHRQGRTCVKDCSGSE
eukprot:1688423-Prymnesium_polylepis.1